MRLFDDTTEEAFGVVSLEQAKQLAAERELDLVEVAPQAQPPVCRLMDYGRFKFEQLKKDREARREHSTISVKEMKLRPKISEHDFQTKFGHVKRFLEEGSKVKLTIMFRGREMVHQEFGRRLLDRITEQLQDVAAVDRNPLVEGRNMTMVLSPSHGKKAAAKATTDGANGERGSLAGVPASEVVEAPVKEVEVDVDVEPVPVSDSGDEGGGNAETA